MFFCFLHVAVQDGHASAKIFIAYAGVTSGVSTLWIAQEQGFFRKYGVDADVIAIRNTPTQLAALISGDIQIGFGGGSAVVGAAPGRADLKIIATFVNSGFPNRAPPKPVTTVSSGFSTVNPIPPWRACETSSA